MDNTVEQEGGVAYPRIAQSLRLPHPPRPRTGTPEHIPLLHSLIRFELCLGVTTIVTSLGSSSRRFWPKLTVMLTIAGSTGSLPGDEDQALTAHRSGLLAVEAGLQETERSMVPRVLGCRRDGEKSAAIDNEGR